MALKSSSSNSPFARRIHFRAMGYAKPRVIAKHPAERFPPKENEM